MWEDNNHLNNRKQRHLEEGQERDQGDEEDTSEGNISQSEKDTNEEVIGK